MTGGGIGIWIFEPIRVCTQQPQQCDDTKAQGDPEIAHQSEMSGVGGLDGSSSFKWNDRHLGKRRLDNREQQGGEGVNGYWIDMAK